MRMIPTPRSTVQSFEMTGTRSQHPTPTQTTTGSEGQPPSRARADAMASGQQSVVGGRGRGHRHGGGARLAGFWNKVRKGTTKITWVFMNYYKWFVPQFSMAPDHAIHFWWDRWRAFFRLQRGYELAIYESRCMRSAKRLREMMHKICNKGAPYGWIRDDLWNRLVEFWRQDDYKKLMHTNKKN
ncbi:hypothetical protein PIB30_097354 [Stylosanthes scabra]|uniref:Uncharacterized protein n=1 Tax=Stylosanthes scabra TaxID=79078 RepID=A0ABU6TVX7_9FABA|nr:hypothetical protein [Stylosanthes scabra]